MNNDSLTNSPIVKRAPIYWKYLPYFSKIRGLLFLNAIYLRSDIYDNIHSNNQNPHNVSILIHEQTHYDRMKQMGMIQFGIKYIFSEKGRFEEELAAIKAQMQYLKSRGETYNIERAARALSSVYYLWCASYKDAYDELHKMWNNI